MEPTDVVILIPPGELDAVEVWERRTDEPDLRGVEAVRGVDAEWPWSMGVAVMEFVRKDPLESEFRDAIFQALSSVP
jgi:hypothetical protein